MSSLKQGVAVVTVLAAIAALAPVPQYKTDRDTYERVGRQILVADCSDLHCFRVLVPIVVEQLPGPSWVKWKAYAIAANAAAAILAGRVALAFGLPATVATLAVWLSALGFGSLFTLFDPHTADPLMFALGPALTLLLLSNRIKAASGLATIGIFAKEFAAAPLWIATGVAWLARRRSTFVRLLVASAAVTTIWVVFQLTMVTAFDYSYGNSHSVQLTNGAYFVHWVREVGPRTAAVSLFTEFGALWLLGPTGLLLAPQALRQWVLAALPPAVVFTYVQQPDRALWNFHFLVTPLAALAAARLPLPAAWMLVAFYGLANLRIGAQLPFAPSARFGVLVSLVLAIVALARLKPSFGDAQQPASAINRRELPPTAGERRMLRWVAAGTAVALIASGALMIDSWIHRRSEQAMGFNKWGYRGPVMRQKAPGEIRVAVLGGPFAYSAGVEWEKSFPAVLQQYARQPWREMRVDAISVVNLATPADSPEAFAAALEDYDYLTPDVVVIVAEPGSSADPHGWRRRSLVFRATGYLPALPDALSGALTPETRVSASPAAPRVEPIVHLAETLVAAGRRVIVVAPPRQSAAHDEQLRALERDLRTRVRDDSRLRVVDLQRFVNFADPALASDALHLTLRGHEAVAEALTPPLLTLVRH